MWLSTRHELKKLRPASVSIDSTAINPVKSARCLGVILDDELKLAKHVATVCRSSYYQIRQLKHIRRYLDFDSAKTLMHSFLTSRVDYCNSLLASVPVYQTDQLHYVLNAADPLLHRVPRFDLDLRVKIKDRLHWLRVPERVTFKACTLVYKSLHGSAPQYLAELCNPVASDSYRRNLRTAFKNELIVPRHKLSTYRSRSFGIAGPIAWNLLPQHLRYDELSYERFSMRLKSHLFRISYDCIA